MKTSHDVGGEPDAPMKYENKQYELWEHNTYVIAEAPRRRIRPHATLNPS
jgi:hypothetical protein